MILCSPAGQVKCVEDGSHSLMGEASALLGAVIARTKARGNLPRAGLERLLRRFTPRNDIFTRTSAPPVAESLLGMGARAGTPFFCTG